VVDWCEVDAHDPTTPMSVAPIPAFADPKIAAMVLTRKAIHVPRLRITIALVVSCVTDAVLTPPMCVAPIPVVADSLIAAINGA
jgi:hypothetical protein